MGQLVGSIAATGATVLNLTAEGTADWRHWGTGNNVNNTDHKSLGGTQISNFSFVGSVSSNLAYNNSPLAASWTDGTPNTSVTETANGGTGVYFISTTTGGATFTAPADTTVRVLKVYLGIYSGVGNQFKAHLSDSSASDYTDSSITSAASTPAQAVYTLTYAANSASQTLTITWQMNSNPNGNGNVTLQSATLALAAVTKLFRQSLLNAIGAGGPFFANPIGRRIVRWRWRPAFAKLNG